MVNSIKNQLLADSCENDRPTKDITNLDINKSHHLHKAAFKHLKRRNWLTRLQSDSFNSKEMLCSSQILHTTAK